jgi:hypothetical protein
MAAMTRIAIAIMLLEVATIELLEIANIERPVPLVRHAGARTDMVATASRAAIAAIAGVIPK